MKYLVPTVDFFFIFESRGCVIRSGKNLPIGFGTIFVEFITKHSMLYIIRKHFLHLFQEYKVHGNLMNLLTFMMIHQFCGQNGSFTQKTKNMVIWRIISHKIKYLWHCESFGPTILYITTPIGENRNFRKFYKWRHIDRKWANSSNSCMKLLSGRLLIHFGRK